MNGLIRKLKLYRISTMLSIFPNYWKSSKEIACHFGAEGIVPRLRIYFDMLLCMFRYGASDENYLSFEFYMKKHAYRDRFITWRRNMRIMKKTPQEIISLFLDKIQFNNRFAKYVGRSWLDCSKADSEAIMAFIKQYQSVILKPTDSACGVGIRKISCEQLGDLKLSDIAGHSYILEEAIENCADIAKLNPSSLNTLRVVTATDDKGLPHIITIVLRMGVGDNITDNAHQGGIACCVNSLTGALSVVGRTFKDEKYYSHPTTHFEFKNCIIPNIENVKRFVIELASEEPSARLVGWDIVLTKSGIEVLEANIPPGEDLTELDLNGKWFYIKELIS